MKLKFKKMNLIYISEFEKNLKKNFKTKKNW